jgi:carboxyl-terminal processing protease
MPRFQIARLLAGLLLLGVAVAGSGRPAAGQDRVRGPALYEQVCREVTRRFFDKQFNGKDWPAIQRRHAAAARDAQDRPRALRAAINAMLGELKISHLALLEPEIYRDLVLPEMRNRPVWQYGIDWVARPGGVFVASVWEGSPAARAGLKGGEQLHAIDGVDPLEHPDFLPAGSDPGMPGDPGYHLVAKGEAARRLKFTGGRVIALQAERMTQTDAAKRSIRIITRKHSRIGYLRFRHFLFPGMVQLAREALTKRFAECDAVILDMRGRGGYPQVLFGMLAAVQQAQATGPRWAGRCATLLDGKSRSAKEIWAYWYRKRVLGPVIGERTQGAVVAATFFPMRDGSSLMCPIRDVRNMTEGNYLEGVGVAPHYAVDKSKARPGTDHILGAALDILWTDFGLKNPPPEEDVFHREDQQETRRHRATGNGGRRRGDQAWTLSLSFPSVPLCLLLERDYRGGSLASSARASSTLSWSDGSRRASLMKSARWRRARSTSFMREAQTPIESSASRWPEWIFRTAENS